MEGEITISTPVLIAAIFVVALVLSAAISAATHTDGYSGPVPPPPPTVWRSETTTTTKTYKTPQPKSPKPQKVIR